MRLFVSVYSIGDSELGRGSIEPLGLPLLMGMLQEILGDRTRPVTVENLHFIGPRNITTMPPLALTIRLTNAYMKPGTLCIAT